MAGRDLKPDHRRHNCLIRAHELLCNDGLPTAGSRICEPAGLDTLPARPVRPVSKSEQNPASCVVPPPPSEYKQFYQATRARVTSPKRARYKWEYEQLYDYVLFMANTGVRPDEAARLEYRDVTIVDDDSTNEAILEIEVRGGPKLSIAKTQMEPCFR